MTYMRTEAKTLWNSLGQLLSDCGACMIEGPPGTGKLSVVWSWVCWCTCQYDCKVAWMHFYITRGDGIMIRMGKAEHGIKFL